jgi:hypothetical protein
MYKKANIPPEIDPLLNYFNIPLYANEMDDKQGLYDIEWWW